jgi:hypothetical protein
MVGTETVTENFLRESPMTYLCMMYIFVEEFKNCLEFESIYTLQRIIEDSK